MTDQSKIFAVHLGIFATPEDRNRVYARGMERVSAFEDVSLRGSQYVDGEQATALDPDFSVNELYEELPQQWRDEHPGEDPGLRRISEIRLVVASRGPGPDELTTALAQGACPVLDHPGPCPVPWSADFVTGEDKVSVEYLHSSRTQGPTP
ncbi:hypothetical protein E0L36_26915 [Streptomyces sp. AJS327]|uniref:hypothetical protein n=1 Tax=Streptomyces sp. AJS327 TaxID=2545265 RepID=UPI0015DE4B59|nr:hypothetical protein [Streptomyces sp. AJS327]MBA0054347.1 hypothetical protein [Streptomyces sp. AJS327]